LSIVELHLYDLDRVVYNQDHLRIDSLCNCLGPPNLHGSDFPIFDDAFKTSTP